MKTTTMIRCDDLESIIFSSNQHNIPLKVEKTLNYLKKRYKGNKDISFFIEIKATKIYEFKQPKP